MSSNQPPGWPYNQLWESLTFRAARQDLCAELNISERRLDDILEGLSWALGENPLQFEQIDDSDAYFAPIRGLGVHPDLIVLYTYKIASNETTLEWVGAVPRRRR